MDAVDYFRKISHKILVPRTSLCEGFAISHLMSSPFMPLLIANAIILIIFSTMAYAIDDPASSLRKHISAISTLLLCFCYDPAALGHVE
jgi:hypothetical protein